MNTEGFIANRIRFKGRVAVTAMAISFFVIIIAVAISAGFRNEIRNGGSSITGDVLLTNSWFDYYSDSHPVDISPSFLPAIKAVKGVKKVSPAIYRAGIIKKGEDIHVVLFKGTDGDSLSLCARIPSKLAEQTGLKAGDNMLVYFVSDKVKIRKFKVSGIYNSIIDTEDSQIVYVPIEDMRRLNGWSDSQASALEVTLDENLRSREEIKEKTEEIGAISYMSPDSSEESFAATSVVDKYAQLFDWLDLIDFNVYAILILMTVVAGFNMISGLLIMLFRNTSTIGILKTLGMKDRQIAGICMLAGKAEALLFCLIHGTTHFIKLNPEHYFVSSVPVYVNMPQILITDAVAFAVTIVLMLIPTLFISKVDRSEEHTSELQS